MDGVDPELLKAAFEKANAEGGDKMDFTEDEKTKFQKAFDDPEFRKMFAEYMDDMQNPEYREETEQYISQLEGEQKVPKGKEMIRPTAGFVGKTYKIIKDKKEEKVFINVVASEKVAKPTNKQTKEGQNWSLPYSLGPPHMEKDKNGSNVACFDCCFHPEALDLSRGHSRFRDLLVHSAMDGIEEGYRRQKLEVKLNRDYHMLKGVSYKTGIIPAMMIDITARNSWDGGSDKSTVVEAEGALREAVDTVKTKSTFAPAASSTKGSNGNTDTKADKSTVLDAEKALREAVGEIDTTSGPTTTSSKKNEPSVKKGFLNKKQKETPLVQELDEKGKAKKKSAAAAAASKSPSPSVTDGLTSVKATEMPPPVTLGAEMKEGKTVYKKREQESAPVSKKVSETTATTGSKTDIEVPVFTVTERGNVSLGDFEGMNQKQVASNRPAELIYKIEIPKVLKAGDVQLDVTRKQLKLTYKDVYKLVLELPYPVDEKKGKAKFESSVKVLNVTLKVLAGEVTSVRGAIQPSVTPSSPNQSDKEKGTTAESQSPLKEKKSIPPVRAQQKVFEKVTEKVSAHEKWVQSDEADIAAKAESDRLRDEVKKAAEAALAKAKEDAKNAPPPAPQTKRSNQPFVKPPAIPVSEEKPAFEIPYGCKFHKTEYWQGRVPGYAFKIGDEGLGYYLDPRSRVKPEGGPEPLKPMNFTPPAAAEEKPSEEQTNKVKANSSQQQTRKQVEVSGAVDFPFEFRQTKPALALLIQISNIEAGSVSVHFSSKGVDIAFKTSTDEPKSYKSGFTAWGDIDPAHCRFDVASQNMVVVLVKKEEVFWTISKDDMLMKRAYQPPAIQSKPIATPISDAVKIQEKLSQMTFASEEVLLELD